jgi:Ca2+-binding RTX toxin-like protein
MFEALESRRLFAVTATFSAGVLTITSDHASDHVSIRTTHGDLFVYSGHHLVAAVHDVDAIVVNLNGGDDSLSTEAGVHAPMTIRGGAGNDVLVAGSGHDMISGDEGDDQITSNDGVVDMVDGGAGNDTALVDHVDHVTNVEHVHHGGHHHHHFAIASDKNDDIRSLLD